MIAFFIVRATYRHPRRLGPRADHRSRAGGLRGVAGVGLGAVAVAGREQQAASLEETSASMEEMASMTRQNAENSQQAAHLMGDVDAA